MPLDKSQIRKGAFLVGGICPGDGAPVGKRQPLPKDLEHFEATVAAAGPTYGPIFEREMVAIKEMTERLQQVRKQLDGYRTRRK